MLLYGALTVKLFNGKLFEVVERNKTGRLS